MLPAIVGKREYYKVVNDLLELVSMGDYESNLKGLKEDKTEHLHFTIADVTIKVHLTSKHC